MCTQFKSSSDPDAFSRTDYNDYDLVNNLKSISREEDQWKGERFEYDEANQLKKASYRVEVGPHDAPQGGPAPGPAETADVAEVPKDSAEEAVAAQEPDPVREPLAGGDAPDSQTGPRTVTYLNDAITRLSMSMNISGTVTTTTYTPNKLNQYTAVTGHNTPVYDANFDLKGYDGWTFVYDADKRLISVGGNGHSAQFVYDGLGRCVRRTIDGDATVFTFDEWKPIVEWDSSGTHVAWNLYGPGADEVLTRYQYNTELYLHYHLDAMGNVQFLMSANNLGLEKYTYDAFGKPTITTWDGAPLAFSQVGNRFMFTGREYLYTFGIYDYRHRHYHPSLGRFLQTDPIGFKGDAVNLYRYCGGNPVNHSDPTGLFVYSLTSWGGGDWIAGPDGITNFDVHLLNEAKIVDAIRGFEKQMNAERPGDAKVKWSGRINQIHDSTEKFNRGVVATTDWTVGSTASSAGGNITGFGNELRVNIHWNDSAPERHQQMARDMTFPKGEFAHARDAFHYGSHSGQIGRRVFPSARDTANGVARRLIGSGTPTGAAGQQMEDALRPWVLDSMAASKENLDHTDHVYY